MRIIIHILLISVLIVFKTQGQDIKMITETSYYELAPGAMTEREHKMKLKMIKSYPEHSDLYFSSKTVSKLDKNGNVISFTDFKENGDIYFIADYEYDDSENILKENHNYPLNPELNRLVTYSYNNNNQPVQIADSSLGLIRQTDISYSVPTIKKSALRINDKLVNKWITKSDSLGSFEITAVYDSNDSALTIIKSWFDNDYRLIKQIDFNSNQEPSVTQTFKYDKEGNKIYESKEFHNNSRIVERYWLTGTLNNSTDHKTFLNDKLDDFTRIFYDEHGNEIRIERYDPEITDPVCIISIGEFKYKYDDFNNWIEKQEFWDGEIESITYRQIEYYE